MRKEKTRKDYKKPPLNVICPFSFTKKINASTLLKNRWQSRHIGLEKEQSPEPVEQDRRRMPVTQSEWYSSSSQEGRDEVKQGEGVSSLGVSQSVLKRKKPMEFRKKVKKCSPYVQNQKDLDRMMLMLKPVSGPTESLKKQIQRHNNLNRKNVQIVLMNSKESFRQKICKFSTRIGLANNSRIFVMNSQDRHIRAALKARNWVEAADKNSPFFHLKWVYMDSIADYCKLEAGQFYNHFRNNQELTNKNLLRKNIKKAAPPQRPFFPDTFDLDLGEDEVHFSREITRIEMYSELHFFVSEFGRACPSLVQEFETVKHLYVVPGKGVEKVGKSLFCLAAMKPQSKGILGGVLEPTSFRKEENQHLRPYRNYLYEFCENLDKHVEEERKEAKWHGKRLSMKALRSCSTEGKELKGLVKRGIRDVQKKRGLDEQVAKLIRNLIEVIKCDKFIRIHLLALHLATKGLYDSSYGYANSWILKPVGVSRGSGIKIEQGIFNISNNKNGKIVQKYLERPLLLSCGKKFDIRQWVMVKSFNPLKVYVFRSCYCRFSSEKYEEANFDNLNIHLTNYSKQKSAFSREHSTQQSIMSEQELIESLSVIKPDLQWGCLREEINRQILKTIKCCQYEIEQRPQCFQVFGFDILLDRDCQPWVLEVNLSPACQNRADSLNQYLKEMSEGVLDLLENEEPRNWDELDENQLLGNEREPSKQWGKQPDGEEKAVRAIQKIWRAYNSHK